MTSGAGSGLTWVADDDALPLPTGRPGPGFRRRVVTIAPLETIPFVAAEWADAMVTIERGAVELCGTRGGRRRFAAGAVLFLAGLGLAALHNPGIEEAVLIALSRAVPSDPCASA